MEEVWKDIEFYEGIYQCSSLGRVRSLDRMRTYINGSKYLYEGKILTHHYDKDGYCKVNLCNESGVKTHRVHRLIYAAFIGECPKIINHIDGDKTNNNCLNLESVTNRENVAHYYSSIKKSGKTIGVEKRGEKYRAKSILNGKTVHLGTFDTEEQAKAAYCKFVSNHDNSKKYIQ